MSLAAEWPIPALHDPAPPIRPLCPSANQQTLPFPQSLFFFLFPFFLFFLPVVLFLSTSYFISLFILFFPSSSLPHFCSPVSFYVLVFRSSSPPPFFIISHSSFNILSLKIASCFFQCALLPFVISVALRHFRGLLLQCSSSSFCYLYRIESLRVRLLFFTVLLSLL